VDDKITIFRSEYDSLCSENEQMKRDLSALQSTVRQLEDTISLLRGGKDSRTSSTAPTHDIGRSNQISLRSPSGRKSGGQPGHTGCTLSMSEIPDEIIDHYPEVCTHCGEDLQGVDSSSFTRRQSVELPPVSALYIEHRSHSKTCPLCQTKNQGAFAEHLQAPIQYGAGIAAMAGYLSVYQFLPYNRISKLFKDFFGLPLSEGSIDTFLDNLAQKSHPAYQSIQERILESDVVGSDETGCRVGGKKHWFHVWQTPLLTFIVSFASRGYSVVEKYFKDGFIKSFYVSDGY
jgi:transposase